MSALPLTRNPMVFFATWQPSGPTCQAMNDRYAWVTDIPRGVHTVDTRPYWCTLHHNTIQPYIEQELKQRKQYEQAMLDYHSNQEVAAILNAADATHQDPDTERHHEEATTTTTSSTATDDRSFLAAFQAFQLLRFNQLVVDQPETSVSDAAALIEEEWLSVHSRVPIVNNSAKPESQASSAAALVAARVQAKPKASVRQQNPQAHQQATSSATDSATPVLVEPKRPMNPYRIFATERRSTVHRLRPELSFAEVNQVLGAEWRRKTDSEKQV
jgi:hypothetical protein